jgi:hypothetical protein
VLVESLSAEQQVFSGVEGSTFGREGGGLDVLALVEGFYIRK